MKRSAPLTIGLATPDRGEGSEIKGGKKKIRVRKIKHRNICRDTNCDVHNDMSILNITGSAWPQEMCVSVCGLKSVGSSVSAGVCTKQFCTAKAEFSVSPTKCLLQSAHFERALIGWKRTILGWDAAQARRGIDFYISFIGGPARATVSGLKQT